MTHNTHLPAPAIDFVPHDSPMCLIDRIIDYHPESITTEVCITDQSLFCHKGTVPVWIGLEYMAQSAAAWSGYKAHLETHKTSATPIGYLLGTRDYSTDCEAFSVGDILKVHADCLLRSSEGLGSFDCRIERAGVVVARARLSVFQPVKAD